MRPRVRSFATFVVPLVALVSAVPLAVSAQGTTVTLDPMAPALPPAGVVGVPAVGAPLVGAPLVGAPVGAPIGAGAVVVQPGAVMQPGYVITPQNSWGTGVVTPGSPPTFIVPNNAGGTAVVTPGYGTTLVRPNPVGGTTIIGTDPAQGSTIVAPTRRGGAVIVGPGGTGYVVPTPQGAIVQPPGYVQPGVIIRP